MIIREFQDGEELALHDVFFSSVNTLARDRYTETQIAAWAPSSFDRAAWVGRIRTMRPFVVEQSGLIVAYGDLQTSGYIDHFYVAGSHARRGIGTALLEHLCSTAQQRGIARVVSDVSLCAEPFFQRHGFSVSERKTVVVRGVEMPNARMCRQLG
jgi:putative acetyltransferase